LTLIEYEQKSLGLQNSLVETMQGSMDELTEMVDRMKVNMEKQQKNMDAIFSDIEEVSSQVQLSIKSLENSIDTQSQKSIAFHQDVLKQYQALTGKDYELIKNILGKM